jgi:hypothetical protein
MQPFLVCCFKECQNEFKCLKTLKKCLTLSHHPFHKICIPLASDFINTLLLQKLIRVTTLAFSMFVFCFSSAISESSELQFCMVVHEIGTSTQPHIAVWEYEFCPCFFISHRTHTALISSSFQGQNDYCVVHKVGSVGWWKQFVFSVGLPGVVAPFHPSALGPQPMHIWNVGLIVLNYKMRGR